MAWFLISTLAYFIIAWEVILDKFLLSSRRVSHPAIYAFYSGMLSSFAFIFAPFGFHFVSIDQAILSVIAGMIFVYGILSLFFAINKNEASRVTPVVGAVIPIITYIFSIFFLAEKLNSKELFGVAALIGGGLLISLNVFESAKKRNFFGGLSVSILAGFLLAVAFTIYKILYKEDSFINVFIWTRFGLVLGSISLLIFPPWRRIIKKSFSGFGKPKRENYTSGSLFVVVKILGGTGSILLNYAISLGNVTVVNALISLEYLFIFIFGLIFSRRFPQFFRESRNWKIIVQKITAIIIITLGVYLVSTSLAIIH